MTYGSKKWREWVLEEEEGRPFIRRTLEAGINFFDTADMYSLGASEEILGRALKDFGPSRDKIVIVTKVFNPMGDDPKALYIGASSMYAWQFQRMLHISGERGLARFVSMQNHYNLVYREEEREMIPLCRAEGIGLIPWSPLARASWPGTARSRTAARPCAPGPTTSPTDCITAILISL